MWNWLETAAKWHRDNMPFAIVTVIANQGSTPRDPGAKLLVRPNGEFSGTIGGGRLEQLILEDARAHLDQAVHGAKKYPLCFRTGQCCGGAVDVFIELMCVGPTLLVFGAGHVGISLLNALEGTPFQMHSIDQRREWIERRDIPECVKKHHGDPLTLLENLNWHNRDCYAVVMTHDHHLDLEIIHAIIEKPARFIGLIGSETKWARFRQRLQQRGVDEDAINRVQCPIGVARWGKAPREVAISAAAQLLKVYYER